MRKGDLDNAKSLQTVLTQVYDLGQRIASDIGWLHLIKGVHYKNAIDLAQVFSTYNHRYKNMGHFSLQHEANTLLGGTRMIDAVPHNPPNYSIAAIRLYKKYCVKSPHLLESTKQQLL